MAVWLPRLAVDRWRLSEGCGRGEGADASPTALIAETAHGLRIDAVNDAGLAAGAAPGMMLPDARAICSRLKVVASDPAGDRIFLERLALWARRWGPWSALDESDGLPVPDSLLIDVTAVAHLFGGETAILADVRAALDSRGWMVRAAIAPTAGAAWALAHFGDFCRPARTVLAPDEDGQACMADLPVAALRLDDATLLMLRRLGLKRIRDLAGIGRDALKRRFRSRNPAASPLLRMDQLLGRLAEPLVPVVAVMPPMVQRKLAEPVRHRDLLDRIVADLAVDLAGELERRGEGARRLELYLWRLDGDAAQRSFEMAAATRDPAHMTRLLATRLDDVESGFGIELVQLCAVWVEPLAIPQKTLDAAPDKQGTSLATCIDRLTVRLGAQAVRRAVLRGSHLPERAQRWQAPLVPEKTSQNIYDLHFRPLKLLEKAELISMLDTGAQGYPRRFRWRGALHDVVRVEGPERIAPEWWRQKGTARLRDYYRVEDAAGRRYWIYRYGLPGDGRGGTPQWFLHGLCG